MSVVTNAPNKILIGSFLEQKTVKKFIALSALALVQEYKSLKF